MYVHKNMCTKVSEQNLSGTRSSSPLHEQKKENYSLGVYLHNEILNSREKEQTFPTKIQMNLTDSVKETPSFYLLTVLFVKGMIFIYKVKQI